MDENGRSDFLEILDKRMVASRTLEGAKLKPPYRQATKQDAPDMARLVNLAGEGMALHVWSKTVGSEEAAWEIGRQRAQRDSGSFSYSNCVVREHEGKIVACLIGYPLPDSPDPIDYDETPAMFVPLQELENLAPRTWYVNVLATYPEHRDKGYGTELLSIAEELALRTSRTGMSLIVSDANLGARRLYERCGYMEAATRPMVKEGWQNDGEHWVLFTKTL